MTKRELVAEAIFSTSRRKYPWHLASPCTQAIYLCQADAALKAVEAADYDPEALPDGEPEEPREQDEAGAWDFYEQNGLK